MNVNAIIQLIAASILPLLFAITIHEAAHGFIASKLGDKTALMLGRVTLNPLKHIDPFGTVILPILMLILSTAYLGQGFIFGYAKPVPVNWQNLRNPKRDMALVALAGPFANLIMAVFWAIIAKVSYMIFTGSGNGTIIQDTMRFIHLASRLGIFYNLILMVLNLIPIPPLDGSRVVSALLPNRIALMYESIEPFGIWILLALLVAGVLKSVIWPIVIALYTIIKTFFGLP